MPVALRCVYCCNVVQFPLPLTALRISCLHTCTGEDKNTRFSGGGRSLVLDDECMADYTEFYFHICKFHGIYAIGVVLVVWSGVCGKHAFQGV